MLSLNGVPFYFYYFVNVHLLTETYCVAHVNHSFIMITQEIDMYALHAVLDTICNILMFYNYFRLIPTFRFHTVLEQLNLKYNLDIRDFSKYLLLL